MASQIPPPPPTAGYPQQYPAPPMYVQAPPGNGIGTAAGVLGIVGMVLAFIPFVDYISFLLGVLAIIFGAIGISRANRRGGAGKGMAITGLVLGVIQVLLTVLFVAAVYSALSHA